MKTNIKWWLVGGIVVILVLSWIFTPSATSPDHNKIVDWLTKSPMDLVETSPGVFTHRGRTASAETGQASAVVPATTTPTKRTISVSIPSAGVMEVVDYEWRGLICLEDMRVVSEILTPGVWWEVRFGGDDNNIYSLYPMDWKTNSVLQVKNQHKIREWRVKPGQTITQALVAWEISPRR